MITSRIDQVRQGKTLKLTLSGSMSETSDYGHLAFDGLDAVDIDLEGVTRVNSAGILLWTRMIKAIPANVRVTLHKCSVTVMHQVQIFPLFLDKGRVKVRSFYAEYDCGACSAEADLLLNVTEIGKDGSFPKRACLKCGTPMQVLNSGRAAFLTRGG